MVAAFEMKRKASMYVRAKVSKTGELNDKKLWAHSISEDLFKKITSIPEGKNHGMIMYLDMSGSMRDNLVSTIEQLINLSMFCNKINIPFEVYGFTDRSSYRRITDIHTPSDDVEIKDKDLNIHDLSLIKMLSSSFTKAQMETAYKCLILWRDSFSHIGRKYRYTELYHKCNHLELGSTPLNTTIIVGTEVAKRFRENNNVEILNTIFLTDGEATDSGDYFSVCNEGVIRHERAKTIRNLHIKYGSSVRPVFNSRGASSVVNLTTTMLEIYKDLTGSKAINYHLLPYWTKTSIDNTDDYYFAGHTGDFKYREWEEIVKKGRKSGVIEIEDKVGFDVRYLVSDRSMNITDESLTVESNKKSDLVKGFKKFAETKAKSRVFVQKFIPQIV